MGVAEFLLDKGQQVIYVSPHQYAGVELESTHQPLLYKRLFEKGMEFECNTDIVDFRAPTLRTANVDTGKESAVEGIDGLVLAYGSRSHTDLYEQLKGMYSDVFIVGDAVSPRRIHQAIAEAYELTISI